MGPRRAAAQVLEPAALGGAGRHFSDVVSAAVLSHVERTTGVSPDEILRQAGDDRAVDHVASGAGWSDHRQFRAILQHAAAALGGPAGLRGLGAALALDEDAQPYVDAMNDLGSPADLYRDAGALAHLFMPAIDMTVEQPDPMRCTVRLRLQPGLEPFAELCALVSGLLSLLPRLFGFDTAHVEHSACSCQGAVACVFAVSWSEPEFSADLARVVRTRRRAERARVRGLLDAVGTLGAGPGIDESLDTLVGATHRATRGLGVVLALGPQSVTSRRVFWSGVDADEAEAMAVALLGEADAIGGPVVAVTGAGGAHGFMAVVPPVGVVTRDQLEVARAYAEIAAAALDSATELAGARRQADGSAQLLALSAALAETLSVEEAARCIAAAVPDLLRCEQVVVVVRDPNLPIGRLAALQGFPSDATERLQRQVVAMFDHPPGAGAIRHAAGDEPVTALDRCLLEGGCSEWLVVPLAVDDDVVGVLVAGVTGQGTLPEPGPTELDTVEGLVHQAALSIRSAVLHEQTRIDALHDALTGLANRALFRDRVDLALARARRHSTTGAVLAVDIDGFGSINERFGRATGDLVLRSVANRLALALRKTDCLARIGADAFGVVLEGSAGFPSAQVAERLLGVVRQPLATTGTEPPISVTASIGMAHFDPTADVETLSSNAVVAASHAASAGGDGLAEHQVRGPAGA